MSQISKEKILADLEAARAGAMEKGQFAAAIRAAELLGKHLGLFKDPGDCAGPVLIRVRTGIDREGD